jgi:hypothetical protein
MSQPERKLDHGLQAMLDILTGYLGNAATRTEWLEETQRRFTYRGKLRHGWSNDSIDRKITKLEAMGLITGGRGQGVSYSAVTRAQSDHPASNRKLAAEGTEPDLFDVVNAAKQQLLREGTSSAV